MNTILAVSLTVLLALFVMTLGAQNNINGYCGTNGFHKFSSCNWRKTTPEGINEDTNLCYHDFPGYTNRSRICVEGLLCSDPACNKMTGNSTICFLNIIKECRSLRLYKGK